jgi:hypothetical protein
MMMARWVRLISVAALSMAGVLMERLKTSSGRLEGCPGDDAILDAARAGAGQAAAFANGGPVAGGGVDGGGGAAAPRLFLEGQLRARWPGLSQLRQWTWLVQARTKW